MRELVKKLSILFRRSAIHLDRELADMGITQGQIKYLMWVCEHSGQSQDQLASALWINKGAVARAVQRFERDGYISRVVCENNRRQYGLFPTEKTRKVYDTIRSIEAEWEEHMMRNLSNEERDDLERLLNRLLNDMD